MSNLQGYVLTGDAINATQGNPSLAGLVLLGYNFM